jgi:hypothetical protein
VDRKRKTIVALKIWQIDVPRSPKEENSEMAQQFEMRHLKQNAEQSGWRTVRAAAQQGRRLLPSELRC